MTLATLVTRTALEPEPDLALAPRPRRVGPDWEVLLMSERLGRLLTSALAGRPARTAPLGWVFAHAGQWGIFLPPESDEPAWPPDTTYLQAGTSLTLPTPGARPDAWTGASGWVSRDGNRLSRPLLVHPVLTSLAADA
ncbi:hypothetical protein RI578_41200 (plasmid) [Streptomyces sp. BB1-1-1]|uniref:hypothetical protein n=1 Tax=Streptomyces sp. BB1-1-1 TaxID=3074430 RepID=UPI002877F396|nr:hypothetical protein [Streptomyces sp. BB1-1-1]WND40711.1 hypothetical protein RI578_41200 [Streptomyces sp. BB1-1-1]